MKRRITILFYAIFLMLGGCKANGNNNDAINTTGYMVLIGEDSAIVDKVRDVDILVIDASYFSKEEIDRLKSNNIDRIYSYLNIGSIENFRSYYADYEEYTIGDYENWPEEKWIDVSQPEWKEFVLKESIELSEKGIDGFFIDNVDVYYQYQNDNIYDGLIDILYDIKTLNKPIIINGGDTFIKKYLESGDERVLFDGVNQECVYTTYDFINGCYKKNSKKEKQYFTEYLDMLVENGYLVYVLEYAIDSNIADSAYFYAKKHNYICYVSDNIDLQICE